jgi:hypothetical protein
MSSKGFFEEDLGHALDGSRAHIDLQGLANRL